MPLDGNNSEKKYEKLLPLLRMLAKDARDDASGERKNAANIFLRAWSEAAIPISEFIKWMRTHKSFIDNSFRTTNESQIKELLLTSVEAFQLLLPDDGAAKAYIATVQAHFNHEDNSAAHEAKRQILLDIVILRKEAQKLRAANQASTAESFEEEIRSIAVEHKISPFDIDSFYLEREQVILGLYRKVDLWEKIRDPQRKQALETEIKTTADQYGLMKDNGSGLDYSQEFMDIYLGQYNEDREQYAETIKNLENAFTIKYRQKPENSTQASNPEADGTSPDTQAEYMGEATAYSSPPQPTRMTIFPLRNFSGEVSAYIGAQDYNEAVEKVVKAGNAFSLSQDFDLNNITVGGKDKIEVWQHGAIDGWKLVAREIVWKAEKSDTTTTLTNSTFDAKIADIELGISQGVAITLDENGKITILGSTQNAAIELKKKGALVINDRFEDSSFVGNSSDVSIEFSGDAARAVGSKFVGRLPVISKLAEGALLKEYTKEKAGETLASIEDIIKTAFSLGQPGYFNYDFSPSFYQPRFITLSSTESTVFNYLMTASAMGYSGDIKIVSEKSLVKKFVGAKWGALWQSFYANAQSNSEPIHLLVQPLLSKPSDFQRGRAVQKGVYEYRLTFITGEIRTNHLGGKLVGSLSQRKKDFGYPEGYFDKLEQYLNEDGKRSFSLSVSVDTAASSFVAVNNLKTDSLRILAKLYQDLKALKFQDLLSKTKLLWFRLSTEDSNVKRDSYSEANGMSDYGDKNFVNGSQLEAYRDAVKKLTTLIPNQAPVVLDGKYFENCTFTGHFDRVILESLGGNHFIKLLGQSLVISGNWDSAQFAECKIAGGSTGDVVFNGAGLNATAFSLSGDSDSNFEANGIISVDSDFGLKDYKSFSGKNSQFKGKKISFANIKKVDLSGATFEGCELNFENVDEIEACGAKFTNCKLITKHKGAIAEKTVILSSAEITGSKFQISGGKLDITNAVIAGSSNFSGNFVSIIGVGAQLGSGIESNDTTEYELESSSMDVTDLKIGNLSVHKAKAFGASFNDVGWKTVTVIGVPSIMPDAKVLFDKLKLAKNYVAERGSLATDKGALKAKEFKLD